MVKLTVSSLLTTALFFLSAPVRAQTDFSLKYTYFDSPTGGGSTGEFLLFVPGTYGYEMTIGFEFNGVDYTEYQVSAVLDGTTVTATCPSIVALSTLALIPNDDASAYTLTWVNGTVALPEGTLTNAFELVNGQLEAIVPSIPTGVWASPGDIFAWEAGEPQEFGSYALAQISTDVTC
ncbi:hypothetical protein BT96DRAFT_973804 [Gymnopus androsaceus JB14]|uniref:Uncharacterized protein n=1 Tax=Gymnopus androsaceus JB14 TaxID=1447944 RepID=A0A6A4I332_9AGAR|nr:hypothetical protein BT96DRAFT_973804 [Gymnopus androsaceus JB14]